MRRNSARAAGASNQWKDWPAVTKSTLAAEGGGFRAAVHAVKTRSGRKLPFGAGPHIGVGLDGEDIAAEIQKQPRENAGAGADIGNAGARREAAFGSQPGCDRGG
jgi:hypothetical protein